jgi:TonB family protein
MKKYLCLLIQLLVFSSAMIAQPSNQSASAPAPPELGKWWKNSEVVKDLRFSESQVVRIEQAFLQYRPTLANLTTDLKNREAEMRVLMQADSLDESKILNQSKLIAATRAQLEEANASMLLAIRKELTKEQWEKLQQIRELQRAMKMPLSPPAPEVPRKHASKPAANPLSSGDKIYRMADYPIVPPVCVYQPLPGYTDEARAAKVEGTMLLQAVIRKNGQVTDIKVLQGLGYGLDESAIDTITHRWKFEPGTLNGQPVDVQANIEVSFRLY